MSLRPSAPSRAPDHQTIGLLWAVVVLRLAALGWATVVVLIDVNGVTELRAGLALAVLGVLAAWTVALATTVRRADRRMRPDALGAAWILAVDIGLAALVAALDHVVYAGPHPQSFASVWPMSAAVVAGLLRGEVAGGAAGLLIGASAGVGTALFAPDGLDGRWTATVGTVVLLVVAGALAGLVTVVLRRADAAEARAAAREEVARRLHDGVLQTLAVVQRRSQDPDLVALARDQELDLRAFISDDASASSVLGPRTGGRVTGSRVTGSRVTSGRVTGGSGSTDLVAALRQVLGNTERVHGLRGELVVVEPPGPTDDVVVEAVHGAVGECLTNVVKHADATRAVVCLDVVDDTLICTVNDDGAGFDVDDTAEGTGLRRSVRGRIEELGGTVQVRSRAGHGSEVELRLPLLPGRATRHGPVD